MWCFRLIDSHTHSQPPRHLSHFYNLTVNFQLPTSASHHHRHAEPQLYHHRP